MRRVKRRNLASLSLSNSPRFSHRERGQKKEKKKKKKKKKKKNASSFSLSLSLSKRTSFFLRARVQSNKRMRFLSFFFLLLLLLLRKIQKKKLLLLLLYVCGEITAHRTRICVYVRRRRDLFPLRCCCCCCSLFFFRKPVSLYLSLLRCKCVFVNEEKEREKFVRKNPKKNTPKEERDS